MKISKFIQSANKMVKKVSICVQKQVQISVTLYFSFSCITVKGFNTTFHNNYTATANKAPQQEGLRFNHSQKGIFFRSNKNLMMKKKEVSPSVIIFCGKRWKFIRLRFCTFLRM